MPQMESLTDRQKLFDILLAAESKLKHTERYKEFHISDDNSQVSWITQETYSQAEKQEAAEAIAQILTDNGFSGIMVDVTVRDDCYTNFETAVS